MTTATYWYGALFGFCVGVGLVGTLLFIENLRRR